MGGSFTPTKKGGMAEKVLAMLKGEGVTTSFGSFSHKESGGGEAKKNIL